MKQFGIDELYCKPNQQRVAGEIIVFLIKMKGKHLNINIGKYWFFWFTIKNVLYAV